MSYSSAAAYRIAPGVSLALLFLSAPLLAQEGPSFEVPFEEQDFQDGVTLTLEGEQQDARWRWYLDGEVDPRLEAMPDTWRQAPQGAAALEGMSEEELREAMRAAAADLELPPASSWRVTSDAPGAVHRDPSAPPDPSGGLPPCAQHCTDQVDCGEGCWLTHDAGEGGADVTTGDGGFAEAAAEQGLLLRGIAPEERSTAPRVVQTVCGSYGICSNPPPPPRRSPPPGEDGLGEGVLGAEGSDWTTCGGAPVSEFERLARQDLLIGDKDFAAGFRAEGTLLGSHKVDPQGETTERMEASALLALVLRLFAKDLYLGQLDAKASSTVSPLMGRYGYAEANARIFGIPIWERRTGKQLAETWKTTHKFVDVGTTFTIVFVPVTVGVSAGGALGLTVSGGVGGSRVLLDATPWAEVFGEAFGGVGVPFLSLGIAAHLNFIRASIPLEGEVRWSSQCADWGLSARGQWELLSGYIKLVLKLFGAEPEFKLASWPGLTTSVEFARARGQIATF